MGREEEEEAVFQMFLFKPSPGKIACWLERAQYQREKETLRTEGLIGGRGQRS